MEDIKISIIVPVYNVERYLEKCLSSLTGQSLREIEIICINDGSTDDSGKILEHFAETDKRIVLLNQKNKGVSAARNEGIAKARGKYIAFVDSDDYVDEELYEETYRLIEKYKADILVFGGEVFTEEEIKDEYLKDAFSFFQNNLNVKSAFYVDDSVGALVECPGSWPLIWNKLYKRELVMKSGRFSEALDLGEDEAFLFSIFPLADRIIYTDKKYYHYLRNRPESATDRLVMDFENKAFSNLKMAEMVRDVWRRYGILEKYEQKYLERYVGLLFDNARSLDYIPPVQKEYMQKVISFFNEFPQFSRDMIGIWYERYFLKDELNRSRDETRQKQNEIWGLINSKNVAEGQVAVLKEVAIGRNRKEKEKKRKSRKPFLKLRQRLEIPYLTNIRNIFWQLDQNGYMTYARLKQAYGEDCVFFTCAFAGIGDAYLVGCYIHTWLKQKRIEKYRFLLGGKSERKMVEALFPELKDHITMITQKEHEWLRNMDRICGMKTDFYFFHHYDYMQPHLQITNLLQGYQKLSMKDLYLYQMKLPAESVPRKPERIDKYDKEIDGLFHRYSLKKGKTILIAPFSTCLGSLSDGFWRPIVNHLKFCGYSVCSNCAPGDRALPGTISIFLEFRYLLQFINHAGFFLGFRSGLCDVVSSCECRMAVVYPYKSEKWGDGNSINYVGIQNMGWKDDLLEVELEKDNLNLKQVQEKIINYFK